MEGENVSSYIMTLLLLILISSAVSVTALVLLRRERPKPRPDINANFVTVTSKPRRISATKNQEGPLVIATDSLQSSQPSHTYHKHYDNESYCGSHSHKRTYFITGLIDAPPLLTTRWHHLVILSLWYFAICVLLLHLLLIVCCCVKIATYPYVHVLTRCSYLFHCVQAMLRHY